MPVKTFKGITDATLEWQTKELLARETHRDQWTVYVRPELVVEIAFSDLQASVRYPAGLALRLARVKRYRDDKGAEDADTMESVRRIYAAQAGPGFRPLPHAGSASLDAGFHRAPVVHALIGALSGRRLAGILGRIKAGLFRRPLMALV